MKKLLLNLLIFFNKFKNFLTNYFNNKYIEK